MKPDRDRFVDTAGWLAFLDSNERRHHAVKQAIGQADALLTTAPVLYETVTALAGAGGHRMAVRGLDLFNEGYCAIVRPDPSVEREASRLLRNRPDKKYTFVDCLSFVVMRAVGLNTAITLDHDFKREGFQIEPAAA